MATLARIDSTASEITGIRRRRQVARFVRNRSVMVGIVVIGLVALTAIFAPVLTTRDPGALDTSRILKSPSSEAFLGTDQYGRDLFARVIYGSRISLGVGLTVMMSTTVLGVVIGLLVGYYPRVDNVIMRMMDMLMAFPSFLLALGIIAILGPRLINVIVALSIVYTPSASRVVRGAVLQLRERDFVEAARALGSRDRRILLRHILPNCAAPLIVQQTVIFAYAVLAEASLSFIGAGVQPDVSSWGIILSQGRQYLQTAPWIALYAGIAISITVLAVNLLGDGLRDIFDPHMGP